MATQQIIALGGGGFSMESSPVLDDYILAAAGKPHPRICFVATASGDAEGYLLRFYRRFTSADCTPTELSLFRRSVADLEAFACAQDVIYVGGGNTANMLAVWRAHSFDRALRRAYSAGVVLAGLSAGSICWFESGITDSYGLTLQGTEALGFLPGSHCPHYDSEAACRPTYQRLIREGLAPGIAADDGVGLHYVAGKLHRVVASRPEARAYRVFLSSGEVVEEAIVPELLTEGGAA